MAANVNHHNWQKFWRFYFWFFTILIAILLIRQSFTSNFSGINIILSILTLTSFILILLALYGYAYKERIFSAIFWKIFLLIYLANTIFNVVYGFFDYSIPQFGISMALVILTITPSIIAIYLYTFRFFKEFRDERKRNEKFQWRFTPFVKSKQPHQKTRDVAETIDRVYKSPNTRGF